MQMNERSLKRNGLLKQQILTEILTNHSGGNTTLPNWSAAAKKMILIQPSPAAAEQVFSLLKASFGEQQDMALQDYIEASHMLQ